MSGIVYNLANTLLVMHPFEQYINCMRDLGITGARVYAAKLINTFELAALAGKIGGGPYRFCEVIGHAGETVTHEMYYHVADITEFNYPIKLAANFQDAGSLQYLSSVGESGDLMHRRQQCELRHHRQRQ